MNRQQKGWETRRQREAQAKREETVLREALKIAPIPSIIEMVLRLPKDYVGEPRRIWETLDYRVGSLLSCLDGKTAELKEAKEKIERSYAERDKLLDENVKLSSANDQFAKLEQIRTATSLRVSIGDKQFGPIYGAGIDAYLFMDKARIEERARAVASEALAENLKAKLDAVRVEVERLRPPPAGERFPTGNTGLLLLAALIVCGVAVMAGAGVR